MDEITILTRRLERERRARRAAEEIAENKSRELYQKGQQISRALAAETTARTETQALLRALEVFSSTRVTEEILAHLRDFVTQAVPCAILTITDDPAPGATMTLEVPEALFGASRVVVHRTKTTPPPARGPALIRALVRQAGLALENARLFEQVQKLSVTDPLTGLHNRRYLTEQGQRMVALAARHHKPLALAMIDLDHFKGVNDTHGHAVGDDVLRAAAATLGATQRCTDLCARFGGEELCVVSPETSLDGARESAERFLVALGALTHTGKDAALFHVTASIGVASLSSRSETLEALIRRADAALYRAKGEGRNRVVTEPRRPD